MKSPEKRKIYREANREKLLAKQRSRREMRSQEDVIKRRENYRLQRKATRLRSRGLPEHLIYERLESYKLHLENKLNKVIEDPASNDRMQYLIEFKEANKIIEDPMSRDRKEYMIEYNKRKSLERKDRKESGLYVFQHISDVDNKPFYIGYATLNEVVSRKKWGPNWGKVAVNGYSTEILHKNVSISEAKRIVKQLINQHKFIEDGGTVLNIKNRVKSSKTFNTPAITIETIEKMKDYVRTLNLETMNKTPRLFYDKFLTYSQSTYNIHSLVEHTGLSRPSVNKYLSIIMEAID